MFTPFWLAMTVKSIRIIGEIQINEMLNFILRSLKDFLHFELHFCSEPVLFDQTL